jgi:hypothetical protein
LVVGQAPFSGEWRVSQLEHLLPGPHNHFHSSTCKARYCFKFGLTLVYRYTDICFVID